MGLYNTKINFVGSGQIIAGVDTILFGDTFIDGYLPLAEAGHSGLDVRFVNTSILGALNELLNGLIDTSGSIGNSVMCYTEAVDTAQFVHTLTHNLGTLALQLQMYDADPASGPVAQNVMTCWRPIDANTVQVELDTAASGYFVVFGCPTP